MHLRPADFFTSNPALDVPSMPNKASVLVPCCGQETDENSAQKSAPERGNTDAEPGLSQKTRTLSVQDTPESHLQGGGSEVDAKKAGANVEENGEKDGLKGRLSKAAQRLFGGEGKDGEQKS